MFKTLRSQIALMVTVPILGLIFTSGISIVEKTEVSDSFRVATPLAEVSLVASELIHELQKERGKTVGLITSGYSDANQKVVNEQRALTDPRINAFIKTVETSDIRRLDPELIEFLDQVVDGKTELPGHRSNVDSRAVSVPENVKFYTDIIHVLVTVISKAVEASPSEKLTHKLLPYLALVEAKEAAGLERAIGAALFNNIAQGKFSMPQYLVYYGKLAEERAFLGEFRNFASHEMIDTFDQTVTGPVVDQVMAWRAVLAEMPTSLDGQGIDGSAWFEAATQRIGLIYGLEQSIGQRAVEIARELTAEVIADQWNLIIIDTVLVLLAGGIAIFVALRINRGVNKVTGDIRRLNNGDHAFTVAMQDRADEFGDIARSLEGFRQNAEEREMLEKKAAETQKQAERQRLAMLEKLAEDFQATFGAAVSKLERHSGELKVVSDELGAKSEQGGNRSVTVAEAALNTSSQVDTVAQSGQEMSSTIHEVASRVTETTASMKEVVGEVDDAAKRITNLQNASQQIGNVINLIDDIAAQTNLLALNATIEAARAGDAGKGFAVVASEVKNLSSQTAQATAQIAAEIQSIQAQTGSAVDSIRSIETSIQNADEVIAAIAAAVEEQSATASQISQSMGIVADAASTVTDEISYVCQAAAGSSGAGIKVLWSVEDLNEVKQEIQDGADRFLKELRDNGMAAE